MLASTDRRTPLLALLAAHRPWPGQESAAAPRLAAFIEANPRCFERGLPIGHITGSAWIVDAGRGAALLVHHAKLGRWLQPGGHADGENDALAVALREAYEETGLTTLRPVTEAIFDIDIHAIPERGAEPRHFHYDIRFLIEAGRDEEPVCSAESHALRWIALDEIAAYNPEASIARLVEKTRLHPPRDSG